MSKSCVLDPDFCVSAQRLSPYRDSAFSVAIVDGNYVICGLSGRPNPGPDGSRKQDPNVLTKFGVVKLDSVTGTPMKDVGLMRFGFPDTTGTQTCVPVVVTEHENKFLVGGSAQYGSLSRDNLWFALSRHNADGSLDTSFGTDRNGQFNGKGLVYHDVNPQGVNDEIFDVKVDSLGRIYATGFSNKHDVSGAKPPFNFGTTRYHPNGVLDSSFGVNGVVITDILDGSDDRPNTMFINPHDNSIVVGGRTKIPGETHFNFSFVKYLENGTLDKNFGRYTGARWRNLAIKKGRVVNNFGGDCYPMKILPDPFAPGCFFAAGRGPTDDFVLVRYLPHGEIDTKTFAAQRDGVLSFHFSNPFSSPPLPTKDYLHSAFIDEAEKHIYLVGESSILVDDVRVSRAAIARANWDGTLDTTFGDLGRVIITLPNFTSCFIRDAKLDTRDRSIICVGDGFHETLKPEYPHFVAFKVQLRTKFVIASRKSKLAMVQSVHVRDTLSRRFPHLQFEIQGYDTTGDDVLNVALSKIGDKGLFTQRLEDGLRECKADFAVHSLKDMPTSLPKGLILGAITERENPVDVVVGKPLSEAKVVGTSALRRQAQISGKTFVDIRGNLDTRLNKLKAGQCDSLILARAGLERQGEVYSSQITEELTDMYYAVGQGALGIECRESDSFVRSLLKTLHHEETARRCEAERAFMAFLQGGCHAPIGVRSAIRNNKVWLAGKVWSLDGSLSVGVELTQNDVEGESSQDLGAKVGQQVSDGVQEMVTKTLKPNAVTDWIVKAPADKALNFLATLSEQAVEAMNM